MGIWLDLGEKFERFPICRLGENVPFNQVCPQSSRISSYAVRPVGFPCSLSGTLASVSLVLWTRQGRSWSTSSVWWSFRLQHSLGFSCKADWGQSLLTPAQGGASGSLPQVAAVRSGCCPGAKRQRAQHWHQAAPLRYVTLPRGVHKLLMRFPQPCFLLWTVYTVLEQQMYLDPVVEWAPDNCVNVVLASLLPLLQAKQLLAWRIGGPDRGSREKGWCWFWRGMCGTLSCFVLKIIE